jgi:predicted kinase
MVGPPGSGKSSKAKALARNEGYIYINQDSQQKEHLVLFHQAIQDGKDIVIDRLNFNKIQRDRYLNPAKGKGYQTEIIVLHESFKTCFDRCLARKDHETIKVEADASNALNMFFSKYERVQDSEADTVTRVWPEGFKEPVIWSDLDGTLCDVEHRRHFVRGECKKDWNGFFKGMADDTVNWPVMDLLKNFSKSHGVVYCSGRPDNWRKQTQDWLKDNSAPHGLLFMRPRSDSRPDNIVKEIMLDFEVLTRFDVYFCLDDRNQVVKMLRQRGLTVFQVAEGNF